MNESLKTVSSGFKLVYFGFLLQVLGIVIEIVYVALLQRGALGLAGFQMFENVMYVCAGFTIVGLILGLVGRIQCMSVPAEIGAKQLIVFSVVMSSIAVVIDLLYYANMYIQLFVSLDTLLLLIPAGYIASLIAIILFLLFTRSTAKFIRRGDLAAKAQFVLLIVMLLVVLFIAWQVVLRTGAGVMMVVGLAPGAGGAGAGDMYLILFWAMLAVLAGFAIRYGNLLTAMGTATLAFAKKSVSDFDEEDEEERPRRKAKDDDDEWEN